MKPSLSLALDADERACAGHPRTVVSLLLRAAYNAAMQPAGSTVENKIRELPRLETLRLVLRALSLSDVDDIFAYASDSEVTRYTIFERHVSSNTTVEWLRSVIDMYRDGHPGDGEGWHEVRGRIAAVRVLQGSVSGPGHLQHLAP